MKFLYFIYELIDDLFTVILKDSFIEIVRSIRMKDPCDTCLVKPCCNINHKYCLEKEIVNCFVYPHRSLKEKKRMAWFVLSVFSIAITSVLVSIFRTI